LVASMEEGDREGVQFNGKFFDASSIQNLIQQFIPNLPQAVHKFKECFRRGPCFGRPSAEKKEEPMKEEKQEKNREDIFIPEMFIPVEKKVE